MTAEKTTIGYQLIALDVGQKYLGVARAQSQARLPEPIAIWLVDGHEFDRLQALVDELQPEVLVIGRPSRVANPDWFSQWCQHLAQQLKFDGRTVYQDETLTTLAAEPRPGGRVDDRAAAIILADYLETLD